jgi:hypothetical protein
VMEGGEDGLAALGWFGTQHSNTPILQHSSKAMEWWSNGNSDPHPDFQIVLIPMTPELHVLIQSSNPPALHPSNPPPLQHSNTPAFMKILTSPTCYPVGSTTFLLLKVPLMGNSYS